MSPACCLCVVLAWICILGPTASAAQSTTRITILVDAFGLPSGLRPDWGYSALVEHDGKRILFDAGNSAENFAHNTDVLGVDLTDLDFVVISHRHGDHTDGLHHLLGLNPNVRIYAANDEYFGGPTPALFFRRPDASLPEHMRYFGGEVPEVVPHGTPWRGANIQRVDGALEIAPGITLVSNISPSGAFSETPEISLVIQTPEGQVLLVGCSLPGHRADPGLRGGEAESGAAADRWAAPGHHSGTRDPAAGDRTARRMASRGRRTGSLYRRAGLRCPARRLRQKVPIRRDRYGDSAPLAAQPMHAGNDPGSTLVPGGRPMALPMQRGLGLAMAALLCGCAREPAIDPPNPLDAAPVDASRITSSDEVAAWAYRREASADLDGDGVAELVVLASDVVVSPAGVPLWEDGHRWAAYVQGHSGDRTLLYGAFVPNGFAEAAVSTPDQAGRRRVLVQERTPHQVRALEVEYLGPGAARASSSAHYQVEQWLPGSASLR